MDDSSETVYGATVWEEGARTAQKIFAVLVGKGLRKDKRDMPSLDELVKEERVFCSCGDPCLETPGELDWEALVCHVFDHLRLNGLRTKTIVPDGASTEGAPVWLNDHDLASCVMYLPDGADTSEASKRFTPYEDARERAIVLLDQYLEMLLPACRLCDSLTPDDKKDDTLFLSEYASAMVYYMQAKHGKAFEEKDIVFWEKTHFNKPRAS